MDKEYITEICIQEAAKSTSLKRKEGAIIVLDGEIIGKGHNYASDGGSCEYKSFDGSFIDRNELIHAEISAIENAKLNKKSLRGSGIYVTHKPCSNCEAHISAEGINNIFVVDDFMKFDTDKLRYELIPPEVLKAMAEIYTHGAEKYKPGNWKKCSDMSVYISALYRHLEAYRMGELLDEDSGMLHMAHALVNASFITYFLLKQKDEEDNDKV